MNTRCPFRLVTIVLSWFALLSLPAQSVASPLESGGFKFVAVAAGDSTVALPIQIATTSSGLTIRALMKADAPGAVSVVKPDNVVLDAASIVAASGQYLDLSAPAEGDKPNALYGAWIPATGRIVTIVLPGPLVPGTYTLRADFDAPLAEPVVFHATWDTQEELRTHLSVSHQTAFLDRPIVIALGAAQIVLQSATPITGATVTATVTTPDNLDQPVVPHDDGTSPDGAANDGL